MLTELRISDFAIIDTLELRFSEGLVTFTGETGAGKSIIIDAVEAIMGGRVDSTMIRSGAERAVIEGDFFVDPRVRTPVHEILQRESLLDDEAYLTLGREIRAEGRHIARVNGRSVNLSILKELGEHLVDVHGQSEHLSLLRIKAHLQLLDAYAGVEEPLGRYKETYSRLRKVRKTLDELNKQERDAARRIDLLQYQIDEISLADPQPGEDETLKQEQTRLANAESLATLSQEALYAIDEGNHETPSAIDVFGQALEAINQLAKTDPALKDIKSRSQEIFDNMADIALELRNYQETVEFNPERLEEVEERLDLLRGLKRKYGATLEQVLAFAASAEEELDNIQHAEKRIAELQAEEKTLLNELAIRGENLYQARKQAADRLATEIERQLQDLRMEHALFGVEFQRKTDPTGVELENGERVAISPDGLDAVQFLVAPNPGEGLKPLARIASGGEMSRLMLAMKSVLAQADTTPSLIFDEIDQGIGGRIGTIVGEKLWQLARQHQVLCITHLPQLAAFGEQHYRVLKQVTDGRTSTSVEALDGENRRFELAQMLGNVSEGTLKSAGELMETAGKMKEKQVAQHT